MNNLPEILILFDGVCNYCNKMVNLCIKQDKNKILRYTPLQSNLGKRLKIEYRIPETVDSIVVIANNKAYLYSDAALQITKRLPFPFKLLYIFIVVPKPFRNWFYKWFAANRYKWFGKKDSCMIPSKEVKQLFLDN
jgi:predicted DCC family thiol-disulfide oxidoreductase YuxK